MSVSTKVEGLREVQEKLKALDKKTAKKDVRTALRAGAKVIADEGSAIAPHRTGLMGKSIIVRGGRKGGGERGMTRVTVTYNKKLYTGKKGFYADAADVGHFTGGRVSKEEFKAASKSVNWSKDKVIRAGQNVALYHRLSRSKGRKFIPGANVLERAAEAKATEAVQKFSETLQGLIEQPA